MKLTNAIASARADNDGTSYATKLLVDGYELISDEPLSVGGTALGPTPGDYLCAALASCKAITLRMYDQRKKWQVGEISVKVKLIKGDQTASGQNTFYCEIQFSALLPDEQRNRLMEVAKACPVSRLLSKQSEVITTIN